jgi:hypothetical protein
MLLILSVHSIYAQTIYQPPQNKNDTVVTEPQNIEPKPTEQEIPEQNNKKTDTNQRKILGRYSIFPKSQIKNTINPAFERGAFGVNGALKGNIQQFKSSETYGGTNSQFGTPRKEVDPKDIPAEFRDLFKK